MSPFRLAVVLGVAVSAVAAEPPARVPPTVLALGLEPVPPNTRPGPAYSAAALDYAMILGIERTPKGRLWAAWIAGGDSDKGMALAASSDDGGATWGEPRLVIDPSDAPTGLARRALVGNLWTDPGGRLWLFYDQSMGYFDGRAGVWAVTCDNPDAAEPVWSAPRRIWHGATLNKPTVLAGGEWLLPVSLWQRDKIRPPGIHDGFPELDAFRMANVFVSTDRGRTWERRGGVTFPRPNFDEHSIVELKDGRLWMLARTLDGIHESFSTDRGKTWSEPKPAIPHINARFFLRRLASGRLLLVKHGRIDQCTPKRSHLTAFLSADDGKTWQGGLLLDGRTGVSYPDGFQAPDGTITVAYDHNRAADREILFARFTEDDVLAGAFRSPRAGTRALIHKARGTGWLEPTTADRMQDRTAVVYDGVKPNSMVCDTTLREMPDGSWALFFLAGGDREPSPDNYTALARSTDQGRTWSAAQPFDVGFPREGDTIGQGPTELLVVGNRATLFFGTHAKHWSSQWRSWTIHSDDSGRTWSKPEPLPGRLKERTFIRPHLVTRDGRILLPFQHYTGPAADAEKPPLERAFTNPALGVLMSADGGKTWTEHGNVRLTTDDRYFGWAEPTIAETADGRVVMLIRADRLGGVLYRVESKDGGRTWPALAEKTDIPNPGSKTTLFPFGDNAVALLHNPNPSHRSPLSLWVSFDGLRTWPYRRMLVAESSDGPKGRMNYPDGFVSADRQWLHFVYDDNRHRAVYYAAKLPAVPAGK
jgi:predicted neuraminidase